MSITKASFGKTASGQPVDLYTCENPTGLVVKLTNYGAIVVAVEVPDRTGKRADVTLGFPTLEGYLQRHPYFGSTVGRYCNRIARGKFTLDGREYKLATNNGPNHLHGGEIGFDRVVWTAEEIRSDKEVGVRFRHTSRDGDEGYPGTLQATVAYVLTSDNELRMDYTATTDKATPVNLTNHNYWNLSGDKTKPITSHELTLTSDKYLPVDDTLIPTGQMADVRGTPMDFTKPKTLGADMAKLPKLGDTPIGYDHCFVLRAQDGSLALAARVREPISGRVMEVWTTQPGIQLYTGNFLDGGPGGGGFTQHSAFCLETQHYPDSPNRPEFPTSILKPSQTYRQTTIHRFSVEK